MGRNRKHGIQLRDHLGSINGVPSSEHDRDMGPLHALATYAGEAKDKAEEELKDMRPLKIFDFYPTAMLLHRRVAIFWTIQHC